MHASKETIQIATQAIRIVEMCDVGVAPRPLYRALAALRIDGGRATPSSMLLSYADSVRQARARLVASQKPGPVCLDRPARDAAKLAAIGLAWLEVACMRWENVDVAADLRDQVTRIAERLATVDEMPTDKWADVLARLVAEECS